MKKVRYSIGVNESGREVLRIEKGRKKKEVEIKEPQRAPQKSKGGSKLWLLIVITILFLLVSFILGWLGLKCYADGGNTVSVSCTVLPTMVLGVHNNTIVYSTNENGGLFISVVDEDNKTIDYLRQDKEGQITSDKKIKRVTLVAGY